MTVTCMAIIGSSTFVNTNIVTYSSFLSLSFCHCNNLIKDCLNVDLIEFVVALGMVLLFYLGWTVMLIILFMILHQLLSVIYLFWMSRF
jgi:hypothetical protein